MGGDPKHRTCGPGGGRVLPEYSLGEFLVCEGSVRETKGTGQLAAASQTLRAATLALRSSRLYV